MVRFKDNSLNYMNIKTKNNSDPHGKPRVYFTCHPDDYDKYFDMICNDIFKTQDCAIYYTKDMNKPIPEIYKDTDLGSMNLFVVPITWNLLSKPNRAMDSDLAFAMEHSYPILPLMMESGIDEFYAQRFNKRQYLNPFSHDLTEINYDEKLKKYLDSVLLDNKTIERIRKAFDAYIFLSYRKKDRHHANELMKLIHNNPKYRDIAIWYDEYLTPGENFENVIMSAMNKSEIFTLLVTPNLINEENYVRSVEYKAARKIKKKILPIEMEETDHYILKKQFEDIPHCIDVKNSDEFDNSLLEILKEITIQDLNNDPKHIYYIGLAYLEGIDVEVNIKRGIELITSAGKSKLPEAMKTLFEMYFNGDKVNLDYNQALKWAKELTDYYAKKYGNEHKETLVWMNQQALCYLKLGSKNDCENALNIFTKIYQLQCNSLGEKNHITLLSLYNLAYSYSELGDYEKALELHLKCYKLRCEVLGEENPDTLSSLHNLAYNYSKIGKYKNEVELEEKCYQLRCKILGEKHRATLISLNSLAHCYGILGNYKNALELHIKCYKLQCEVLGDNHLDTIFSLSNIAYIYNNLGEYNKAIELYSTCYKLRCEVLGENHPNTLTSLNGLALSYGNIGNYAKQLELNKICYQLRCDILGEKHYDTLISLNNLAFSYDKLGDYNKALELNKKCYQLYLETLGGETS